MKEKRKLTRGKPEAVKVQNRKTKQADLLKYINDAIIAVDDQFRITSWNRAAEIMYGWSAAEVMGRLSTEIIRSNMTAEEREKVLKRLEEFGEYLIEVVQYRKDGEPVYVEANTIRLYDKDKQFAGLLSVNRDITKRKRAEAARDKLASIVDAIEDAVLSKTLDGVITSWNRGSERLYGYSAKEAIGQSLSTLIIPPERTNELTDILERIRHGEHIEHYETIRIRKDGTRVHISISISPMMDGSGNIVGASTIARDISERKHTEEALRAKNELFEKTFSFSPMAAVLTKVPERTIIDVNPAFEELFGYTRVEMLGKSISEFDLWADSSERQRVAGILIKNGRIRDLEFVFKKKSGQTGYGIFYSETIEQLENKYVLTKVMDITERKQAEDRLRDSEMRFHSTLENMMEGCQIIGNDWRYLYINPSAEAQNRRPNTELMGNIYMNMWPGVESTAVFTAMQRCMKERTTQHIVTEFIFPDNSLGWFEVGIQRVPDGIFILSTDITERKQAEEALRESEQFFAKIFMASPIAISMAGLPDGKNIEVNDAWCKLTGFSREEAIGFSTQELKIFDLEERNKLIEEFTKQGYTRLLESSIITKNGEKREVLISSEVITNKGIPHILTSVIDITERKQTEQELLESEEKFRNLIEHLPTVVYMNAVGDASTTVYVSPQIQTLLGYTPEEWLADPKLWSKRIHPEDRQHVLEETAATDQNVKPFDMEYRMIARDDRTVWVHDKIVLVNDLKGQAQFWQGIMLDITERKRAEEKTLRQIDYLTALQNIDRTIASSFEMRLSLNALILKAVSLLNVDAASVLLLNSSTNILEFAAGDGFQTNAVKTARVKLGNSYAGRAARRQSIVKIPNLKDEEPNDILLKGFLEGEDFVSYYGVPLIVKGESIGVMEVFQRSIVKRDQEWLDFLNALAGQAAVAISHAQLFDGLQHSNKELTQAYDATIAGWSAALDLRDKETEGHSRRVTEMTINLARAMSIGESELLQIRRGALLHDIGKLGVPDHILLKPDKLTDEEWAIMRQHPGNAYKMLAPVAYLRQALDIPYCHHEKWDGTGYPRGLQGEGIPLSARIFAVVDVWDALINDRPYRPGWSKEKAIDFIKEQSGKHFDPQVVEAFLNLIGTM